MLIDLLIILAIAAFIVTRFTKFKLPTDTRTKDQKPKSWKDDWRNALQQPNPLQPADELAKPTLKDVTPKQTAKPKPTRTELQGMDGLTQIKALDDAFTEADFLGGVTNAHSYFYTSLAKADMEALDNLCSPKMMASLPTEAITISGTPTASISSARVSGKSAIITVTIHSTASSSGGPAHPRQEVWTLARPLGGTDPNWELQSLSVVEGQA